jgi:hypothetical protein
MRTMKVCMILSLVALGSGFLFAQQAPSLTPEQQEQYDSQKLTVTGFRVVTISRYGGTIGDSGFGPSSTNWEASQGFERIAEPEFLQMLGLDKEFAQAKSHQQAKSFFTYGGIVATVAGLAIMFIPLIAPATTTDQYGYTTTDYTAGLTTIMAGSVVSLGGMVVWLIGTSMPPNITPYGRAESLANKYNLQLLIRINGGGNDKGSPVSGPA